MSAVKKILVPTDFSKASEAAVEYACGLAEALNASLCIFHSVENPYPIGGEYFEWFERKAGKNLEAVLTPDQKIKYGATVVLRGGPAAQEILRYLQEQDDIDLVVMATHGRGGVSRLVLGSVADKVLRAAPCPVVTIRRLGDEPNRTRAA
jgi:nucleotide-binding universal stress UspA family protein